MVRFSIAFIAALCIASAGFAQVQDTETYILNKNKPDGSLPPIVLDTKNRSIDIYGFSRKDSTSQMMLDTNTRITPRGEMPNSYQGNNCVSIPNAYNGDNCVPIPNAYRGRDIVVPYNIIPNKKGVDGDREAPLKKAFPKKDREGEPEKPH